MLVGSKGSTKGTRDLQYQLLSCPGQLKILFVPTRGIVFPSNAFLVTISFSHCHFTQSPNIDGPGLAGGGLEFDSNDDWKSSAIETEIRCNSAQSGIEKLLNQTTGGFLEAVYFETQV